LNFGAYLLLVFDGVRDRRFMVIEQRDVARFPDFPAEDEGGYVPSDQNNRLERPAHTTALTRNRFEKIRFVVMRFLRMSGQWRIP
jgi:hypothetical protein